MGDTQNWRTEVGAQDYFGHQKKQLQIADRRPVIRRAADLVGPGVGAYATTISDYGNILATFNGYYSSKPGAIDAPNSKDSFVGFVVSDDVLGGTQTFTSLAEGLTYQRTFTRSPTDPNTIQWAAWAQISGGGSAWSTVGGTGVAFQNGWVDRGDIYAPTAFRRTGGLVHLRGVVMNGATDAAIFTLPPGYRPASDGRLLFAAMSNTGAARVDLSSDGRVLAMSPSGTGWLSLSGIIFHAA